MRKTIKRQIATVFICLVAAILLVSLLISSQFLGRYYIANKQTSLIEIYEELNEAAQEAELTSEDTIEELTEKVEVGNITFVVLLEEYVGNRYLTATPNEQRAQELILQLSGYLIGKHQQTSELLKKGDSYEIRSSKDIRSGQEYLEMWGTLSDNSKFIIRSPLESIRESVALSNEFLAYIMMVAVVIGAILVWYFSKRIADPIMELAVLSEKIADLNFEEKYTSGGKNEIGILGENFNIMSEKLESTISELKSANYELQKDIEQKEKAETMRAEFVGNVSHELKTPIALIQGYAEGLKEGVVENAQDREFYCDVIMDEANKMNQLVKNLLTLNQMEFGKEEVSFTRFNVVELMQGVIQSCEIMIKQKEVTVQFAQTEPVYVWADAFKVEQVFSNYFRNALNHVEDEKVIDIRTLPQTETGKVRISVFNTGKQIPEEDIDRIWDKFYKVDKARTREYGGHGIGLSIVKAIMEAFRCDYGVKNYENGVAFWFELEAK